MHPPTRRSGRRLTLLNPIHLGSIRYGRLKQKDDDSNRQDVVAPEHEQITGRDERLRIVPEELAARVGARFAAAQAAGFGPQRGRENKPSSTS